MRADEVCSDEYRNTLQQRYKKPGWGASGYGWAIPVELFMREIGAQSILDYGCGRGTLKKALLQRGVHEIDEYDPGIVGKDKMPKQCDLVVCTDVLEHIEPELLDTVLAHIKSLARKGVFLNIGQGPAKEILPDGRNAHLIQQKMPWWAERLTRAGFTQAIYGASKGITVRIRI